MFVLQVIKELIYVENKPITHTEISPESKYTNSNNKHLIALSNYLKPHLFQAIRNRNDIFNYRN